MKLKGSLLAVLLVSCIFSFKALSQIDFSLNGYFYNMTIYQNLNESFKELGYDFQNNNILINLSRLRLRPAVYLWEGARLEIHHETNLLFSEFSSPLLISPDITNRQAARLSWKIASNKKILLSHFIDRIYLKQSFENATLTFGRQSISWGSGRVWQPTDLFNPINPANFSKFEKDGADALTFKYFFGSFTDLELVINFREKLSDYNFGGRFRTNFNEFDVSGMAGRFDKRVVIGGDFAGNFFGSGVRGEGIFSADETNMNSNFIRLIFGFDYQFSPELYCLIEYQHNGAGKTNKDDYELERLFKGEIQNLNKNYIVGNANYIIHPLINMNVIILSNLNDLSGYSSLSLAYSLLENISLRLGGVYFFGGKKTEYWYFSPSAYFLFEIYF